LFLKEALLKKILLFQDENVPSLRKILKDGDFFVGAAMASSLTKMIRKLYEKKVCGESERNKLSAEVMYIMSNIIRFGLSGNLNLPNNHSQLQFLKYTFCKTV